MFTATTALEEIEPQQGVVNAAGIRWLKLRQLAHYGANISPRRGWQNLLGRLGCKHHAPPGQALLRAEKRMPDHLHLAESRFKSRLQPAPFPL
jgi:hypothetical protein